MTARGQLVRAVVGFLGLAGCAVFGELILAQHLLRVDLTPGRRYTLSPHARQVLSGLAREVTVTAFVRTEDPRNPFIRDLLRRMAASSSYLHTRVLDVNRNPAVARRYGVDTYGALVVESGRRRRIVTSPREETLIGAILGVTRPRRKIIYLTTGHGEKDPTDSDRRHGFATARAALLEEAYEVRRLFLLSRGVPQDAAVVVIAGPEEDFLPEEIASLDAYLKRPGRLLVLLDPGRAPRLASLLARYGIRVGREVVVDPRARLFGGEYLTSKLPLDRSAHPILAGMDAPALFSLSRLVEPEAQIGEGVRASAFLMSGPGSWASVDREIARTGTARFVAGRDRRGPVPVGVEVTYEVEGGPGQSPRHGRIVVYGNSDFASDFFIDYLGNKDLLLNTVAWLASEPELLAARPHRRALGREQFFVSAAQGSVVFWSAAVVEPAVFLAIGAGVFLWRRYRA